MRALLGELEIARLAPRICDGAWQIEAPKAHCNHILQCNLYLTQHEAQEAIKMLVPAKCRECVQFVE